MDVYNFSAIQQQATLTAQEILQQALESKKYSPGKATEWIDTITSRCIEALRGLSPNFKYVVSVIIVQKAGAGLHYDCVTHWDSKADGSTTVKFENETMICFCAVLGIAL